MVKQQNAHHSQGIQWTIFIIASALAFGYVGVVAYKNNSTVFGSADYTSSSKNIRSYGDTFSPTTGIQWRR